MNLYVTINNFPHIIHVYFSSLLPDDIFQRHKRRQRREREEKKRERAIDEINDRQMGKMLSSSINIDIGSTAQFPEYDNNVEMPPLTSNVGKSKKATAGPSYSTVKLSFSQQ